MFLRERDGVLGHHRLPRRRVRSHKDGVVRLQPQDRLFLEDVQLKRPLRRGEKSHETDARGPLTDTRAAPTLNAGLGMRL